MKKPFLLSSSERENCLWVIEGKKHIRDGLRRKGMLNREQNENQS